MPIEIDAIDNVQIAVPRAHEAECLFFYRSVLGLAEIEKPAGLKARGGAWFRIGALQLHVGVDAEPSPKSKRHICFLVASLDRARQELEGNRIAIEESGPAERARRLFVCDPGGNRIEIAQR